MARAIQQRLYKTSGLSLGYHTLTLTKAGGGSLLAEQFDVS